MFKIYKILPDVEFHVLSSDTPTFYRRFRKLYRAVRFGKYVFQIVTISAYVNQLLHIIM